MLKNIEKGSSLIAEIDRYETDPICVAAVQALKTTLLNHKEILMRKLDRLNQQSSMDVNPIESDELRPFLCEDVAGKTPSESAGDVVMETGESQIDRDRRLSIEQTIVKKGEVSFDEVAGLDEAKQTLKEAIIVPIQFPHLFTGGRKPWKRILLYGPPGTGKTRLARAVATEIRSCFYSVSSADLLSSWFGESEKLIKALFAHATGRPDDHSSVIFIDEIDSICRQRNSREEESTRRIKTELLKQMEGVDSHQGGDTVFLLCATNCPWELDSAFIRRFQKRIYVSLPNREARIQLLKIHDKNNELNLTEKQWNQLADLTDGYSGSDLANVMMQAFFSPIRELQASNYWQMTLDGYFIPVDQPLEGSLKANLLELPRDKVRSRSLSFSDVTEAIQHTGKTVSSEDILRFNEFTDKFGVNG
ncbi:vacuolar protein sorting-associated protein 4-like [Tubulanus polymorphus]|uniref:vacuolar protein sorting-associated protein 4-like n=1 Tax=Tubulanus polymorphus TaxID=672921 RepID=UPI003DA446D3